MKVLLAAPAPAGGRISGDDILTELITSRPPDGVEYLPYARGLAEGRIRRSHPLLAWYASLKMHSRPPAGVPYHWPGLPPWPYRLCGKLWPDRPDMDVLWLDSDEPVDLVHTYMHPVRLSGTLAQAPLVLGNASGNADLLERYYGFPPAVSAPWVARDRALMQRLGIDHDLYRSERARAVTVPSLYAWRMHVAAGVPEEKLRLVRLGLPAPPEPAPRPTDVCRFGMVGHGFERKGGDVLVQAFQQLRKEHPEARLTLVSATGPHEGVDVIPALPRERVFTEVYPRIDVYVLASRAEGYGLSVVEAMAHGLPVIASNVGALPELVADGETGLLVPPGDVTALHAAMRGLMEDPALRARMGAAARRRFLREHDVEVTRRALGAVYGEVAARLPGGG